MSNEDLRKLLGILSALANRSAYYHIPEWRSKVRPDGWWRDRYYSVGEYRVRVKLATQRASVILGVKKGPR